MTTVLVAVIGALAMILAASIPAWLTYRAKGAADSAASTGAETLAAVTALHTKVDALHANVVDLLAWKTAHEADHTPTLVPVPRTIRRARP